MNINQFKRHAQGYLHFLLIAFILTTSIDAQDGQKEQFNINLNFPTIGLIAIAAYALGYYSHSPSNVSNTDNSADPVLSFDLRLQLLQKELSATQMKPIEISLIACMTREFSRLNLKDFIQRLQKNTADPINMLRVQAVINDMCFGSPAIYQSPMQYRFNVALHEVGHAITLIHTSTTDILHHISMIRYQKIDGFNYITEQDASKVWTIDDRKNHIKFLLSGGIAEQVFGLEKNWQTNAIYTKITIFFASPPSAKNENICDGMYDLLTRPSVSMDMVEVGKLVRHIAFYDMNLILEDNAIIDEAIYKILEECYQETFKLIQSHKADIEKIAALLMQKDIVSGDEIYTMFNKNRPLYKFEIEENLRLQQQDIINFEDINF